MRGRRNPDRPQGNMLLPPCRVCGEKGSGFHYGVTTCGACKGFFRRSLVRNEPYVCMKSHLCKVGPSTSRRQSCPKCRYDKCISVGMSKDACKVGRYSLVKKSKDIAEMLKYQMDRPGEEGFNIDQALFEKSSSLPQLTSEQRDNDLNSTGTLSSSPCSPDYAEIPPVPVLHPRNLEGKDCDAKIEIPRNSSCFMQESEPLGESYCDMTPYGSEDNVYSDIESKDVYSSYHMNRQNSFGSDFYLKNETYPQTYQTGVTSSSFLEASPVMMDRFTQDLESSAFDPLFPRSQESNYTVLQAANLPQYASTPNPSLSGEPLMPSALSGTAASNVDSPGHENSGSMLSAQRPAFEQANIPPPFCASPIVTSPNSSCDFRINIVTTPQTHSSHEMAMSESRPLCNPEFPCQVSTPFGNSSTPLSSHSLSYSHQATHSAPATPRHQLSEDPVVYSAPVPAHPPRDYSIDELISQSIHTEAWGEQNWTSGNLDQRARHPGSSMTHSSVDKAASHIQTTQSSWVDFKTSAPFVPETNRGHVIVPPTTDLKSENYTRSPTSACGDGFLSMKSDHFLKLKICGNGKTDMKFGVIEEAKIETKTENDENVSKPQCLEIARKDNKRKYDEIGDDDTSIISPTTSTPSSFFLLFICPELAPYGLAMYEQFPFVSYEQQCLKPFLNSCVDTGDTIKSSLMGDANVGHLEIMSDTEIGQCLRTDSELAALSKADGQVTNLGNLLGGEAKFQMTFCDQDLDMILSTLMEAHDRTVGLETNSMTDIEIRTAQDAYMGLCKLRDRLHGPMQFIDKDVYNKVFITTGVDVDKRRAYIGLYANMFNHNLPKVIRFFRAVPGFQALSISDRIVLAREALHEYCLLSSYKGSDQQNDIVINLEYMMAVRLTVLEQLFPELTLLRSHSKQVNVHLKKLNLTQEELVLLKAICLTRPQRKEQLKDPMLAERLHQRLLNCLMSYLKKKHQKPEERFADMTSALKEINFVGSMAQKIIRDNQDHYLLLLSKLPVSLCTEAMFGKTSCDRRAIESMLKADKIQELT